MQFKINVTLQVNHILPVAPDIILFISITGAVPFKVKQTSSPVTDLFMSSLQLQIKGCSPFPAVRGALKIKIFQFSEKMDGMLRTGFQLLLSNNGCKDKRFPRLAL